MHDIPKSYLFSAVAVMFAITFSLRGFVFAAFGGKRNPPKVILFIGSVISPAVICMLIVYCFRTIALTDYPYGLPEIIAALTCIGLHLWRHNPLLSIIVSTIVYMLLIQNVFA